MNAVSSPTRDWSGLGQKAVAVTILLGLCCWWSITYTRGPSGVSTLWVASGVLCGILLTSPRSQWPLLIASGFLASAAVNMVWRGSTWYLAGALSAANVIDAGFVAAVLVLMVGDVDDAAKIKQTALVATLSSVVACALSAAVAATAFALFGRAAFAPAFRAWFAAHGIGMAIFATLTTIARIEDWRLLGPRTRRGELLVTLALIIATSEFVFGQSSYPMPFMLFPLLLLASFRHRFIGFVLGVTPIAIIATMETTAGRGPFMLIPGVGPTERALLLQLFLASICLTALPVAVVLTERAMLMRRLAKREHQYRMLSDYSRDLVIRFDRNGVRRYISPSTSEILGWTREDLKTPRWDIVHPEDLERLHKALAELNTDGAVTTVQYRVRHKEGHYITIEAHARLVPGPNPGDPPDIIYAGRDVTRRVEAERALEENQRRLRAITDNLPAFVIHVDTQEKYTFANAYTTRLLGIGSDAIIGRSVREIVGESAYAEIQPYMQQAFRGEAVTFEIERDFHGRHHHFQSSYVPDVDVSGAVRGFYAVTFDISELKQAERELTRLARYDTLTGLANRLHFRERVELAILRHQRTGRPIALLYLDVDHFKHINDTFGHAVGDAVLCEFAQRLGESVRATDFAARLGGDEFVVLVEDIDESEAAETVARKLIARMRDRVGVRGHELAVTTSIGIAFCRQPIAHTDALMQLADTALYAAKAAGRNTYRLVA